MATAKKTNPEIAAALGYKDRSGAWRAVQSALAARESRSTEEYRRINTGVLEDIIAGVYEEATAGDTDKAAVVIKASAEIAKLHGCYAPTKVEATGKDGGPIVTIGAMSNATPEQIARIAAGEPFDTVLGLAAPPGAGPGASDPATAAPPALPSPGADARGLPSEPPGVRDPEAGREPVEPTGRDS